MVASGQCLTATDRFSVIFFNPFLSLQGLQFTMSCLRTLLGEAGQVTETMSGFDGPPFKKHLDVLTRRGQKGGETAFSMAWGGAGRREALRLYFCF